MEALNRNPNVAYVEPDSLVWTVATQSNATWGLDRIDQRALPLNSAYNYVETGYGVTAYIIDTGIRFDHIDLNGRAVSGFDAIDGGSADDCNGHGTHVAGTVGGENYGVAKDVRLVAVRVLGCDGSGTTSGVIAGIDWVTANAVKPAVANMSLGGGASTSLDTAVKNSIAQGIGYAVAAGNGNFLGIAQNACNYSPARVAEAMTIGATDSADKKASWSNYGDCVDWFAPGVGITSSWYTSDSATNTISGTSMATPHTTGAAALYLQAHATASPQEVRDQLFAAATKGVVLNSKTVNNHLLYSLFDAAPPDNQPPVAGFTFTTAGLTASFTDTSTDSNGTVTGWNWDFDDNGTSSEPSPNHTYASAGTYAVRLTVTDDGGASSEVLSKLVTVSGQTVDITLTVTPRTVRTTYYADLEWIGALGSKVDVYRNDLRLVTTTNDGAYTDKVGKTKGAYKYKICEAGTSTCSNEVTIMFP